jgi:hypothetical protein
LRRTSSRCQRSSVCGVTRNDGHRSLGRARLAVARTTRSNVVSLGRPAVRRRTRSWCCKTMISRSFVASSACGRTSRRVSARTVNESMNSIGGCYGVPGHGANLSFCAPQVGPAASDQVPMPPQQRGRLHQQPAPDRAGQQPRHPASTARSTQSTAAGPPGIAAPRPRGATPAAQHPWPPSSSPAARATAAPGRTADRAVAGSYADHCGLTTRLANLQLKTYV